jgi:hypothetical protein
VSYYHLPRLSPQTPPPSSPSSTRQGSQRGRAHSHPSPSTTISSFIDPARAPAAGAARARAPATAVSDDSITTARKTDEKSCQKAMRGRATEGPGCGGRLLCHPSSSFASSSPFAAAAEPDTDCVSNYRAVAQLCRTSSIPGYTASWNSGSLRPSSGS